MPGAREGKWGITGLRGSPPLSARVRMHSSLEGMTGRGTRWRHKQQVRLLAFRLANAMQRASTPALGMARFSGGRRPGWGGGGRTPPVVWGRLLGCVRGWSGRSQQRSPIARTAPAAASEERQHKGAGGGTTAGVSWHTPPQSHPRHIHSQPASQPHDVCGVVLCKSGRDRPAERAQVFPSSILSPPACSDAC